MIEIKQIESCQNVYNLMINNLMTFFTFVKIDENYISFVK